MTKRFKLYYFPTSFFSQKVLITLYERKVEFDKEVVNIILEEQNEPWYFRINPNGFVPVLKDGEKVILESDDIVDYIDSHVDTGETLIPDSDTKFGKAVQTWRKRLGDIPIEMITFGALVHFPSENKILKAFRVSPEKVQKSLSEVENRLIRKAEEYPEFHADIQKKIAIIHERRTVIANKTTISKYLDDLEVFMDDVEEQLLKTRKEQGLADAWLVGSRFTAADIHLTILFERIKFLGLKDRFLVESRRPCSCDYFRRSQQRYSVQMVHKGLRSLPFIMIRSKLRKMAPYLTVFGLSVGIGILAFVNRNKFL